MTDVVLSLKMNGMEELKKQLRSLPEKTRSKVSKKALKEAAEQMRKEVISRTPRRYGFLQASIKVKTSVRDGLERALIIAGDRRAWYAHLVEYGFTHTSHGWLKVLRKPTSRGHVEGKAFLRNSAESKFESTISIFEETVAKVVEKEINKTKS